MGKIHFVQSEINHNRFLMGLFSAMIFSIFGYLFSNFQNINIYIESLGIGALVVLISSLVYLQFKIKKQMKSLEDIEE
jgi:uncharacterized protein with PQ loop repeat